MVKVMEFVPAGDLKHLLGFPSLKLNNGNVSILQYDVNDPVCFVLAWIRSLQ